MKYKFKDVFAFDDVNEWCYVYIIWFVYAFSDVFSDDSEINPNKDNLCRTTNCSSNLGLLLLSKNHFVLLKNPIFGQMKKWLNEY